MYEGLFYSVRFLLDLTIYPFFHKAKTHKAKSITVKYDKIILNHQVKQACLQSFIMIYPENVHNIVVQGPYDLVFNKNINRYC